VPVFIPMYLLQRTRGGCCVARWAIVSFLLVVGTVGAQEFSFESVGARSGFAVGGKGTADFLQAEAFADCNLPWRSESDSGWWLQPKLNLSLGWLGGNGINSVIGTLGPALVLGHARFPLSLEGGISPTLLGRYEFGSTSYGEPVQFTSYLGLNLDFTRHLRLGYRFQHMSNAGLSHHNPGLNINMVALSYVF